MGRPERAGPADEKLSVNIGPVDLGTIDVLVEEGFYATRADFIRSAVRRQLDEHKSVLDAAITRREFTVGYVRHNAADLRAVKERRQRMDIRVIGVLHLADDIDPDLADEVIERIKVHGTLRAPAAVLARLGERAAKRKGAA